MDVSFVIVHYKVKNELFKCIEAIIKTSTKIKFEIIVVDNDEKKTIRNELVAKFPYVKYIPNINKGFGQGNNVGSKTASGLYLFFLNPDTLIKKGVLKTLYDFLIHHSNYAIAAPFLVNTKNELLPLQGARVLNPLYAIFSFSLIARLLPSNIYKKKYWLEDRRNNDYFIVESIPGAAFLIRKKVFEEIGKFDEKFFLFFEEQDLCKRIHEMGFKQVMIRKAKVLHIGGQSTSKAKKIKNIFNDSRFYYFRKHYGLISALMVELFMRLNKNLVIAYILFIIFVIVMLI